MPKAKCLADFGDNLAVHPTPLDDLDAMINPSIPFSNIWDLKSAQGAHLGFRGKATAGCPGVWDTADAGAAAARAEFNFDNGRADDAIGKRKRNGTQRVARLSRPPYFALQPALYALLRKQVLALALTLTLALALALVLAHAPRARPLRPPLPPPPLRFEFRESDRRIQ
ncbi:hypothetical protein B0H14DRAFT_3678688 [Mycena olivaceomarginata]|nr:hypothetical protein B0H14DRAFT_3678688 [Mycena olivaceomarginata]